jgi:hypothetical protein
MGLAPGFEAETPAYDDVHSAVKSEYALLDAHRELKTSLAEVYRVKNVALVLVSLEMVPFVGPAISAIGQGLYFVVNLVEQFIEVEWNVLGGIESFASSTSEVRRIVYDRVPNLRGYSGQIATGSPSLLEDTAKIIGKRNAQEGAVYPAQPALKLDPEPVALDAPKPPDRLFFKENQPPSEGFKPSHWNSPPKFARSQIVRATYPLVNFHRLPVLDVTRWLVFSNFARHYRNWSTEITLFCCQEDYRRENGPRLYVLGEIEDPDRKASAPWFRSTQASEQTFAVIGFARANKPFIWAPAFFPTTNSGGTVAFAQSLLYNANPRRPSPDNTHYQPVTGWDTLNWDTGTGDPETAAAIEWPYYKKLHGPRVKLNWQAKLVPVTRLREGTSQLSGEFQKVLSKLDPNSPLVSGH